MKDEIIGLLQKEVKRDGIDKLIEYLTTSDFFTAPASTRFHGTQTGDLAKHSHEVYLATSKKNKDYGLNIPEESVIIAAIFHDICKVNFYKKAEDEDATVNQVSYLKRLTGIDNKFYNNLTKKRASDLIDHFANGGTTTNIPKDSPAWKIDDKLPLGHGEKSIFVLQKFIDLTDDEAMAIRWHMATYDPGIHFSYPSGYPFHHSEEICPLLTILFTSDYEVSNIKGI